MATSFKIEHEFLNIPLEKFIAHLNDPKLNQMLEKGLDFAERKLIKRKESDKSIEWQFKVRKSGELPLALKKLIKEDAFSWQEKSELVRAENCIYWEIIPEIKALKFHGHGIWQLIPLKNGCKRIIEGTITVDVPFIGKVAEGFIVKELLKTYEVEPSIQEQFYAHVA